MLSIGREVSEEFSKRPAPFVDRHYTIMIKYSLEEATSIAVPTPEDGRRIARFSEYRMNRCAK